MYTIDLPPSAKNFFGATTAIGYNLMEAIADVIDNSLAAQASIVEVFGPQYEEGCCAILDNGCGMDFETLKEAIRYSSQHPKCERAATDLGRFGLGLKVASLSQCDCLTVISKTKDGTLVGARWDVEVIGQHREKEWPAQFFDNEDFDSVPLIEHLQAKPSGTLVLWQRLHDWTSDNAQLSAAVCNYLELIFHRFLEGSAPQKVIMKFNGRPLQPQSPFDPRGPIIKENECLYSGDSRIKLTAYRLRHQSLWTDEQIAFIERTQFDERTGIYLYRNARLIKWGKNFGLSRSVQISPQIRLQIDLPAATDIDDDWKLDVRKTKVTLPNDFKKFLAQMIQHIGRRGQVRIHHKPHIHREPGRLFCYQKDAQGGLVAQIDLQNDLIKQVCEQCPQALDVFKLLNEQCASLFRQQG